jgi:prophage regulatory protein
MLPEPSILKVHRLDTQTCGNVLCDAVKPFALFGRKRLLRTSLCQPCLIAFAQFLAIGNEGKAGYERMAHQIHEVRKLVSTSALYRFAFHGLNLRIADGVFTHPVSLGGRAVGWPAHEVAALNAARIAGKPDAEIRTLVAQLEAARKAAA